RHAVTFELAVNEDTRRRLFALNDRVRKAGNEVIGTMRSRIGQMRRTKADRKLRRDYGWKTEELKKLAPYSAEYQTLAGRRKETARAMTAMQKDFGITREDVRKLMLQAGKDYGIPSVLASTRGDDIWKGIEKILFAEGKSLHFRKRGDLPVMRAREISKIIVLKVDRQKERLVVCMKGFPTMPLVVSPKDYFLQDEYNALLNFMEHPEQEEEKARQYAATGKVEPVFRPCYCAIRCEEIRGALRCFVEIMVSAEPMRKLDRYGRQRHVPGKGRVGCDIGTQSAAVVSRETVELFNLGERVPGAYAKSLARKKFLLCRINASRRINNPDRFLPDGTYQRGTHGRWVLSRQYRRDREELREICRKESLTRLYANRELANHLRSLGDELITEPSNTAALARRSGKATERTDQTVTVQKKDGTQAVVRKCRRKKRFGVSVAKRSPAAFQRTLQATFGSGYHETPKLTYRASQYDFMLDAYIKKKLSQRWHILPDHRAVQRDLMSAFLLACADDHFETIDRRRCIREFETFWKLHQDCIRQIEEKHLSICNSGICVG
ncbi:MAG: hypothetical protein ACI4OJ_03945, partial [Lachnospiraceae bacterium]